MELLLLPITCLFKLIIFGMIRFWFENSYGVWIWLVFIFLFVDSSHHSLPLFFCQICYLVVSVGSIGIFGPFELDFEPLHTDLEPVHGLNGCLRARRVVETDETFFFVVVFVN